MPVVRDEPVTLSTGPGTLLDRKQVLIDSIVIFDSTGTIPYRKDVHYSIREIGNDQVFVLIRHSAFLLL